MGCFLVVIVIWQRNYLRAFIKKGILSMPRKSFKQQPGMGKTMIYEILKKEISDKRVIFVDSKTN
ncbi:hypothetical protein BZK37_06685 [Enterococcus casseliflavus]|nr:hypothetical protein BZK37_06685 [Enterococcus casseliflavus]